ncbi:hypothetical protein [Aquisalimonas sp.]|uniref:hypothetical protein n=1 Tax=Aquisalimonas sp. TaxID=1872621 RepID=UPI0025C088CA|nr:hypothetical protein [Aquisalimonas sp.]
MKRILGLSIVALLFPLAVIGSEDGEKLRAYLERTCALAGAGEETEQHAACMAEKRESYQTTVAGIREDFEATCAEEDSNDDALNACLRAEGDAKAAEFQAHIAAIEEDPRVQNLPDLHDPLSDLCSLALEQEPGSASHEVCIALHAMRYASFAEAVVEELNDNPALDGF